MDTAVAVEPELLPRTRGWRLRCFEPELESEYRLWRAEQAVPFTQIAMIASVAGWLAFAVASVKIGPHLSRLAIPATLFVIMPLVLAVFGVMRSPRRRLWIVPASAAANMIGGVLAALILHRAGQAVGGMGYTDVATAVMIVFVYYGCTILRLPPLTAVVAISPYVVVQQVLIVQGFAADPTRRISYTVTLWVAVMSGVLLATVLERVSRETFRQERVIAAQRLVIDRERERAERLLLGILPEAIAERLKRDPGTIAEAHEEVTVLFADVVGFTELSSRMPPNDLVSLLNQVFSHFDKLTGDHGVEKIKTIGDAYMAVAGLPAPREDHVVAAANLALAMRERGRAATEGDRRGLDFRIGLHTGPVVAGVIGTTKFAYDLWGDTVNLAARLQSHGPPGQIQVSEAVARVLRPLGYELRERGSVELKGIGPVPAWLLERGPAQGADPTRQS